MAARAAIQPAVTLHKPDPELSILVGTHNRLPLLRRLIKSIEAETGVGHIVRIIDAGSTDGTREYLETLSADRYAVTFAGRLQGQAAAYNEALARVETPFVCWLSDDNLVVNRGLDVAIAILKSDPLIGMVGLKVTDMQGPHAALPYIGAISSAGILNVNQGMLATSLMKEVGGFCETMRDYGIDPDITAKVLRRGHDIVYTRTVAIRHFRQAGPDAGTDSGPTRDKEGWRPRYAERHNPNGPQLLWNAKRALWSLARAAARPLVPQRMDSNKTIFGQTPRDWFNIVNARHISLLDPVHSRGKPYHLRQSGAKARHDGSQTAR